jgi:membrane-associated phospholipid phosphatase
VALAALAVLVVTGALNGADDFGLRRLTYDWHPTPSEPSAVGIVWPFSRDQDAHGVVFAIWTYPASVLVSIAVYVVACRQLVLRGQRTAAVAWAVAFIAGNAVEGLGKSLLGRPALYGRGDEGIVHVRAFDHSFPSGHTLRALLVAAVVAYVWPRFAWPACIWAAGVLVLLIVEGDHVLSDVAGGLVLASFLVCAVHLSLTARPEKSRWPRPVV